MAMIATTPSESAELSEILKLQLPTESAVVLPSELSAAKSSIVVPAFAVPVKVGVLSLVRLSVSELPVSEAGLKSGVEGALTPNAVENMKLVKPS